MRMNKWGRSKNRRFLLRPHLLLWHIAWGLLTLAWVAYWVWITWDMSFDGDDVPFVLRVIVLPPVALYAGGWIIARVIRLLRNLGSE